MSEKTRDRGPAPDLPAEQARMVRKSQEAMRGRKVLEVASGTGSATREIAETAVSVTGVEIAPNMLELAAENDNPPNVCYLAGDAFDLESVAPGRRFDGGFAAGFLHTCPSSRYVENDPTEDDFRRVFEPMTRNLDIHIGNYWWWIRYELP